MKTTPAPRATRLLGSRALAQGRRAAAGRPPVAVTAQRATATAVLASPPSTGWQRRIPSARRGRPPSCGSVRTRINVRRTPSPDPDAEPALYVHGLGGASTNFTDLADLLSPWLDGHAIDLPGFGRSGPPPRRDYSIAAHTRLVIDYLEQSGRGPVHLVGNSMGGAISIQVAARRPGPGAHPEPDLAGGAGPAAEEGLGRADAAAAGARRRAPGAGPAGPAAARTAGAGGDRAVLRPSRAGAGEPARRGGRRAAGPPGLRRGPARRCCGRCGGWSAAT